jgi:hypothetical protein
VVFGLEEAELGQVLLRICQSSPASYYFINDPFSFVTTIQMFMRPDQSVPCHNLSFQLEVYIHLVT